MNFFERMCEVGGQWRGIDAETTVGEVGTMATIRYEIILYWSDENSAFIAEVPKLPGCMADGQTYQEAFENVEVTIREWIDTARELGRPIPPPKGRLIYA